MLIIGLVGGVASGKSLVASQLQAKGAALLDGDRAGHRVLELKEVQSAIRNRWGSRVFTSEGAVDRRAIAKIVFDRAPPGPQELRFLEQLTHPKIRAQLEVEAAQHAAQGVLAAVLDAPVMLKAGWDSFCDYVIFVDADEPTRQRRALQRGWSEDDFQRRELAQESLAEKRARADYVVNNSGTIDKTRQQIEQFWQQYVAKS